MMVFCTLFDSNYLDKGIVMYRSLLETGCRFKMYILAMDNKCKEVLDEYSYDNVVTISVEQFSEEVGLSDIRQTRPWGEFCWTCTSFLIDYVLSKFNEPICTYVDSDLFFYSNPKCLIDEMGDKTVQIVEHRFLDDFLGRERKKSSGTYCVQFNTFKNTSDALELLHWWKDRCLESCSIEKPNSGVFGDQGYMEHWGEKPNVSVLQHLGGGVAPWNVGQYVLQNEGNANTPPILQESVTGKVFPLVFYHYHHITYYDANKVNIHVYSFALADDKLINHLYIPYLRNLDKVKNELKECFAVYPLLTSHPGMREGKKERRKIDIVKMIKKLNYTNIKKKWAFAVERVRKKMDGEKDIVGF